MNIRCLSAFALCALACSLQAIGDDSDFFIPASELPADALIPKNVRQSAAILQPLQLPEVLRSPGKSNGDDRGGMFQEVSTKFKARRTQVDADDVRNRSKEQDVGQRDGDEEDEDEQIAMEGDIPPSPDDVDQSSIEKRQEEARKAYEEYARKRQSEFLDFFAERMVESLNPEEMRAVQSGIDEGFATSELFRLKLQFQVSTDAELEKALLQRRQGIELYRSYYESNQLSRRFCELHKYLFRDADQPNLQSRSGRPVMGTLQYDDGTAVAGAVVSCFYRWYPSTTIKDGESSFGSGWFECQIPDGDQAFAIDFRKAAGWPRVSFINDSNEGTKPAVVDVLLVRSPSSLPHPLTPVAHELDEDDEFETEARATEQAIVVPRSRWGQLTVNWRGPTERILLTAIVIPTQIHNSDAHAAPEAQAGQTLDDRLRYIRSFPVTMRKDESIVVPNLPPGRCVVLARTIFGGSPRVVTTMLPQAAELTIDPDEFAGLDIRGAGIEPFNSNANQQESAQEFFEGIAEAFRGLRDFQTGNIFNADTTTDQLPDPRFAELEYELRLVAPGWESGYRVWTTSSSDLTDFKLDCEGNRLAPGHYNLIVRRGRLSKQIPFEIKPSTTVSIEFNPDELVDPDAAQNPSPEDQGSQLPQLER